MWDDQETVGGERRGSYTFSISPFKRCLWGEEAGVLNGGSQTAQRKGPVNTHRWEPRCSRCHRSSSAAGHRLGGRCIPSANSNGDRLRLAGPREAGTSLSAASPSPTPQQPLPPQLLKSQPRVSCPAWREGGGNGGQELSAACTAKERTDSHLGYTSQFRK